MAQMKRAIRSNWTISATRLFMKHALTTGTSVERQAASSPFQRPQDDKKVTQNEQFHRLRAVAPGQ
jgi:hypothetical protein